MNKTQEYWNILGNINDWIKYSDTKATILLTLYGVLITIIYSNSTDVLIGLNKSNWILGFSIISMIFSLISIIFSFLCINPRLKNENPNSIIYFGHIKEKFKNSDEYSIHSSNILSSDESYLKELTEQIHTNSSIAWKKFSNVTWSIRFFFGVLICLIFSILIYLASF
ncbi:Pycsar system effector family protein [Lutibacter sp.]|uniref:Pycsar system effector family protein n=1 Tax=Lutibacter sp. TaxID=1925666 RepID=UPI002736D437|nr:Pycsar system effector family protein [Lutibacter sp.]MDP3314141.1 DUF5706 domain-containing protein [Lutibacter sp.]